MAFTTSLSSEKDRQQAFLLFLILAAVFVSALVTCNLIFRKFFLWEPFGEGGFSFEQSVGLLPYPITFLVTDIISEVFGRKRANQAVVAGLIASVFVLLFVYMGMAANATGWSEVQNADYEKVFGVTVVGIGASMAAYLIAQSLDVRMFHFWKTRTGGRKLWLRNNLSTIPSQVIDTSVVLLLLCAAGDIAWGNFGVLFLNGVLFKALVALLDTPLVYLCTFAIRKRFGLEWGQEIAL